MAKKRRLVRGQRYTPNVICSFQEKLLAKYFSKIIRIFFSNPTLILLMVHSSKEKTKNLHFKQQSIHIIEFNGKVNNANEKWPSWRKTI